MNICEEMYQRRKCPEMVSRFLEDFLLCEIYSPLVIRTAHDHWDKLPFYAQESVHPEIRELIQKADSLSESDLQKNINAHTIVRAINVLSGYKNCPIPLTKDKTVPTVHKNILSPWGEKALKRFLSAACHSEWDDTTAELALRTSHKFLMSLAYYKICHFPRELADTLVFKSESDKETFYYFPVIELTQGCLNHCAHCCCDAQAHLSCMPWPIWRGLYEQLDQYYKYYEGQVWKKEITPKKFFIIPGKKKWNAYIEKFHRFFHDSDPSQYHDPIIGVDGGDAALSVASKGGDYYFLTKGVTNHLSYRAIAKASKVVPIDLSFVDTPQDIKKSIIQTQKTLNLIHSVHRNQGVRVTHIHLAKPSVLAEKLFPNEEIKHEEIAPLGRASQFFNSAQTAKSSGPFPYVVLPNGNLVWPLNVQGKYQQRKIVNLFTEMRQAPFNDKGNDRA